MDVSGDVLQTIDDKLKDSSLTEDEYQLLQAVMALAGEAVANRMADEDDEVAGFQFGGGPKVGGGFAASFASPLPTGIKGEGETKNTNVNVPNTNIDIDINGKTGWPNVNWD